MTNLVLLFFFMAKQHKYNLTLEADYNYNMIGICSHHSDYRLVWGLNELLKLKLVKAENLFDVHHKKNGFSKHNYFIHKDEEEMLDYYLIKNKAEGKFLIPEKQQIDYFLFLVNNQIIDAEDWLQKIKSHPSVLTAFNFDPTEFSSTENLIFDENY
jgi:hypothetical protein